MGTLLEDSLLNKIIIDDQNAVLQHILKGANPNKITSQGKTCLGEASKLGNLAIVKLLLDSTNEDLSNTLPQNVPKKKHFKSNKIKFKREGKNDESVSKCKSQSQNNVEQRSTNENFKLKNQGTEKNQGYFVFMNSNGSSSDDSRLGNLVSPSSPSSTASTPLADLEWDEDIGTVAPITSEDETWSSIYKWYATILENTGAAIAAAAKVKCGINQQDAFMRTALHYAAEQGHTEIVKILLDAGSKLDISTEDGLTSLHISVINNHIDTVKLLLSVGCHINYKTHDKMTALHFAAARGHLDIVKVLVNNGAFLEARDTNERTALYLAVRRGHVDVIKFLISFGANVNGEEIHGYTPLCEAVWQKYAEIVEVLLLSGAQITHSHKLLHHAIMKRQEDIVKMLVYYGGGINLHNDTGDTPLLLAVSLSQISVVKILLKNKANVNICNNITGANALHIAVKSINCPMQFEQMLMCLLDYKIDMNTTALTGDTALNRALLLQKDYAAMLLIRHGADVNTFDFLSRGLDNLSIVKRRVSNNLANLLLKAGHFKPINKEYCCLTKKETTACWLHKMCKEPLSLSDLCRIQIRLLCKDMPLHCYVHLLPIPNILKKFLMFEDECNVLDFSQFSSQIN